MSNDQSNPCAKRIKSKRSIDEIAPKRQKRVKNGASEGAKSHSPGGINENNEIWDPEFDMNDVESNDDDPPSSSIIDRIFRDGLERKTQKQEAIERIKKRAEKRIVTNIERKSRAVKERSSRRMTPDGLPVYTMDELGLDRAEGGSMLLDTNQFISSHTFDLFIFLANVESRECPFDCWCCF